MVPGLPVWPDWRSFATKGAKFMYWKSDNLAGSLLECCLIDWRYDCSTLCCLFRLFFGNRLSLAWPQAKSLVLGRGPYMSLPWSTAPCRWAWRGRWGARPCWCGSSCTCRWCPPGCNGAGRPEEREKIEKIKTRFNEWRDGVMSYHFCDTKHERPEIGYQIMGKLNIEQRSASLNKNVVYHLIFRNLETGLWS